MNEELHLAARVDETARAVWADYCEENEISLGRRRLRSHRFFWGYYSLGARKQTRSRIPQASAPRKSRIFTQNSFEFAYSVLPGDHVRHPYFGEVTLTLSAAVYNPYVPLQVTHSLLSVP